MTETQAKPEQIAAELAALGEDELSDAELAALADASEDPDEHEAVATVVRLHELAEPIDFEDLSEFETHRSWRAVEGRLGLGETGSAEAEAQPAAQQARGGSSPRLLFAALGLAAAVAAAVVLLVMNPEGSEGPTPSEEVAEVGAHAREMLKVIDDGKSDTQRAEELAADYAERLEGAGG